MVEESFSIGGVVHGQGEVDTAGSKAGRAHTGGLLQAQQGHLLDPLVVSVCLQHLQETWGECTEKNIGDIE